MPLNKETKPYIVTLEKSCRYWWRSDCHFVYITQSVGAVEYVDCFSAVDPHPTSVLDITLNNLMVRLQ